MLEYTILYLLNYAVLQLTQADHMNISLAQFIKVFYLAPLSHFIYNKFLFKHLEELGPKT